MTRIRVTRAAEQDLLDGFAFYEKQQAEIGTYFVDSLSADIDSLQLYAGIHAKPLGRFHRTLARRFPGTTCSAGCLCRASRRRSDSFMIQAHRSRQVGKKCLRIG